MSQDTEVDMKEVELNELEPEKQPMNAASGAAVAVVVSGGAEKNGLVKLKVADDEAEAAAAAKFTGLTKEELLKVAGSPGWVRTRWALLLLFWLGWLGMLAGAVVIIVRAPRCRELPGQRWWHKGALYRIGDLQAFQGGDAGSLAGESGAPPPRATGRLRPRPQIDPLSSPHPVPGAAPWDVVPFLEENRSSPAFTRAADSAPPAPRSHEPVAAGPEAMCRAPYVSSSESRDPDSPFTLCLREGRLG